MRNDGASAVVAGLPRRAWPRLTGLSAHRLSEHLDLRLAPAVTAGAIAYGHLGSEWKAMLVLVSVFGIGAALRNPHYPLNLLPLSSAALYLLVPPLGAFVAIAISTYDGYAVTDISAADMVAPVLGAWIVTGLGALAHHRFHRERQVRMAVIGSHEFAHGLDAELGAVGVRGYRVIGCIDPERGCEEEVVAGIRCLGSLRNLRPTILAHGIELLVLGPLDSSSQDEAADRFRASGPSRLEVFEQVADACLDQPVCMIEAGQLYEDLLGHVPLGTTTSAWFQYLLHPSYRSASETSQRALDLLLGAVAGLIALPLIGLAALVIALTSRGPVLHRQRRIGEEGRDLVVIKLRTMRTDLSGPRWTGEDDERVTRVGRVLRRLHIDELPQIWLVLKGEMSLVGPRPEQSSLVSELESRYSYYDRRHLVKPGITGWAQVRCGYARSHIGSAWKLCHDLYYLKHRSVLFDLLIMLETLTAVVAPKPIYRPDERFIIAAADDDFGVIEKTGLKVS